MSVDKNLEVSKIIRAVMKIHGKKFIYNNLYPSGTRTVKCYGGVGDDRLVDRIDDVLQSIPGCSYEIKQTLRWGFYSRQGFIVKLK